VRSCRSSAPPSLTERLDRLIAVTMRDRTQTADRLADIEERLTRLETR